MQLLRTTRISDMALDIHPETDQPVHDTACHNTQPDEKVFTLAMPGKTDTEILSDSASAHHIHVDGQTVFSRVADSFQHKKLFFPVIIGVIAMVATGLYIFNFTLEVSTPAIGVSAAKIAPPVSEDIAQQIGPAANHSNGKVIAVPTPAEQTMNENEGADTGMEEKRTRDQTETGESGIYQSDYRDAAVDVAVLETMAITTSPAPDQEPGITTTMNYSGGTDGEQMRISRAKIPDRAGTLINAAYAAYVAGNYVDASQAYLGVLQDMPGHRDALLGMAAVALRSGNPEEAGKFWLLVLADNPDDPAAIAGLIDLMAARHNPDSVNVINKLLRDNPRMAFLYFSLGNLQAAASDWPKAQHAFAEALRLESDNPDYVYNLAVSLEHLGDKKAALDKYQHALDLARDRQVQFNKSVLQARISALTETAYGR